MTKDTAESVQKGTAALAGPAAVPRASLAATTPTLVARTAPIGTPANGKVLTYVPSLGRWVEHDPSVSAMTSAGLSANTSRVGLPVSSSAAPRQTNPLNRPSYR